MSNSSPTLNLYELLKEDTTKPSKGKGVGQQKNTPVKRMTPEEKNRIRQEEETEKLRANEQKKWTLRLSVNSKKKH
jgi:hypothetical protein